ncbi:MAG: serine/threonine protein kinase [Pedobacter sp.]|nr:serine/threonine protein kinase [Pedobacter sp.]
MSKVFTITEGLENLGALRTGGQGSVYKGKRIGSIFSAVKLIPTPISKENEGDKNYRNFQNEVSKLQKVNENPSPNVVKMLSFGITESGSFPFIEMEFIDGPDLSELLKPPHEKIFTLKELVKVAGQLAAALAHCHNVGVKHGDIKSNNVKYNIHTGNYVLLDFGLAIMSEEQRRSSIRHAGAIEFMAPEQNEGKMLLQTDIYSYGIILYELLAGQVPFPLNRNSDTERNNVRVGHMENDLPNMMELRKTNLPGTWLEEQKKQEMMAPDWLIALIDKCLQKDPKDRFSNGMVLHECFIESSLSAKPLHANKLDDTTLKAENKALTQKLLEIESQKNPGIVLSHFAFTTIVITLLALIGYSGYSAFKTSEPQGQSQIIAIDSLPVQTDTGTFEGKKQKEPAIIRRVEADSMRKSEEEKEADTTEDLTPDSTIQPPSF